MASKKKYYKKKKSEKANVEAVSPSESKPTSKKFKPNQKKEGTSKLQAYVFIGAALFMFFAFISSYLKLTESTNAYIDANMPYLKFLELALFTITFAVFAYFGWKSLSGDALFLSTKDKLVAGVGLATIIGIYALCFNPAFSNNGDNAHYMVVTKSLAVKGKAIDLYYPNQRPTTIAPLGLPMVLVPIFKMYGYDLVKMKYVVTLMAILSILLSFLLFKRYVKPHFAVVLSILFASHPLIQHFSSILMTETPFVFWSLLAMVLIHRFSEQKTMDWKFFAFVLLAVGTCFMSYLTRAIGIGTVAAALMFLFFKIEWIQAIKAKEIKKVFSSIEFKQFALFFGVIAFGGILWALRPSADAGESQAELFFDRDVWGFFKKNLAVSWDVMSQTLFADQTFRWHQNPNAYPQPDVTSLSKFLNFIFYVGIFYGMYKRQLLAYFTFIVLMVLLLGSSSPVPMVTSRYLIPFIPFLIYFMFLGIKAPVDLINSFVKNKQFAKIAFTISLVCFSSLIFSNFSGTVLQIQKSHTGKMYDVAYGNYLEAAKWCKENLGEEVIIASRKPRIFYVFGERMGLPVTTYREVYSKEYEMKKLQNWKQAGVTHVVLDGFNSSTRQKTLPIVQNNPTYFKLIHTVGTTGPSYILELQNLDQLPEPVEEAEK